MPDRRRGAPPWLLTAVALLLVADGLAVGYVRRHPASTPRIHLGGPITTTGPPQTVLRPDQAVVRGTVTAAHFVDSQGPPLPLPITITIPNRGQGELNISGVVVDGRPQGTVAWDGGQPLPLSGTGGLDVGPSTIDFNASGVTWHLDGAPRLLLPGQYTAGSSVAIGVGGLGQPMDQATFSVARANQATLVSAGDAQVHVGPEAEQLSGPGSVQLLGALQIQTARGTRPVHNL
ncbi:MAG TPA: hypothetical protein VGI06_01925, partial [Acidimicrobiales bacterium]